MTATSRATAGNGIVTRDELVGRAHELRPLLRDYSAKADSQRGLPDAVVTALIDAGMFRMVVPKRLGGYEADLHTVTEVAEILGAGDASAAWVVCLGAVATSLAGRVSARAQDEKFDMAELQDLPAFRSAVRAAIDRVNTELSVVEKVRQFAFADEPFGIENEEMTPSLKIRRHKLKERYGARLDALYKG